MHFVSREVNIVAAIIVMLNHGYTEDRDHMVNYILIYFLLYMQNVPKSHF